MEKQNQLKKIRQHLQNGNTITALEALKLYGCFRLGARIYDLKKEGLDIKSRYIKNNGKKYKEYYL